MQRADGRQPHELRPIRITRHFLKHAEGSALVECGDTKVICAATVEEKVPPFLRNAKKGWVTAEYSLLPRSTQQRTPREAARGRISGRTYEIQRLIGRALRCVVSLELLGERTLWLDCDVIQADGGTRTAAINGSFFALYDALLSLREKGCFDQFPIVDYLGAVSVGIVRGTPCLDLVYEEDAAAEVDMNIVLTGGGRFVEVQGTAEGIAFSSDEMNRLIELARGGIEQIVDLEKKVLGPLP